jgi:hypothetical protein
MYTKNAARTLRSSRRRCRTAVRALVIESPLLAIPTEEALRQAGAWDDPKRDELAALEVAGGRVKRGTVFQSSGSLFVLVVSFAAWAYFSETAAERPSGAILEAGTQATIELTRASVPAAKVADTTRLRPGLRHPSSSTQWCAPLITRRNTNVKLVEPPSCRSASSIIFIGKNSRGNWVAQEQNGLYGGGLDMIVDRHSRQFRHETKMSADQALDQTGVSLAIGAAIETVARRCGEYQREVAWFSRLDEAPL